MDQRVSFITLAVADLDATRAFYVGGLGWEAEVDVPGEVLMIKVGEPARPVALGRGRVRGRGGRDPPGRRPGAVHARPQRAPPATRSTRCSPTARAAGADPVGDAEDRDWGGYTGYFADPDGFRWEVAWNPDPIGQAVLP